MPGRWAESSKKYIGYVAPMTEVNERYVLSKWAEENINKGYSDYEVAIRHNRPDGKKVKGVNKFGAAYDSDGYAKKVLAKLK